MRPREVSLGGQASSNPARGRPFIQLGLLALSTLAAMTLWFSATAVLPALVRVWSLGPTGAAWLTIAVQVGFVAGALLSAFANLPDRMSPRTLVALSALTGAGCNLALAYLARGIEVAVVLRFATGIALAGVYPPSMKIAAGHVGAARRGLSIATLVGALTLGSATPHLIAGVADTLPFREVLAASSVLAVLGAICVITLVREGPFAPKPAPFDPGALRRVVRDRSIMLANAGYFGHMWELYAMWTWLAAYLSAASMPNARLWTFGFIGVAGAIGAIVGGSAADRFGRTAITSTAMVVSGACCVLSGVVFELGTVPKVVFGALWGASIIADSAQFSAAVTELAEAHYMGTALTLQTSVGFALTLIPIWGLPYLAEALTWQWSFAVLAVGPLVGTMAMLRLRALPESLRMAGGRR